MSEKLPQHIRRLASKGFRDAERLGLARRDGIFMVEGTAEQIVLAVLPSLREEWDNEFEAAIEWPQCPNDHPDPKAWIEGRDAAVRAFAAGLNREEEDRG